MTGVGKRFGLKVMLAALECSNEPSAGATVSLRVGNNVIGGSGNHGNPAGQATHKIVHDSKV